MNAAKLTKYGLVPVARVRIADRNFIIDITDPKTVELEMNAFMPSSLEARFTASGPVKRPWRIV